VAIPVESFPDHFLAARTLTIVDPEAASWNIQPASLPLTLNYRGPGHWSVSVCRRPDLGACYLTIEAMSHLHQSKRGWVLGRK
jgi:hypothetical protein